jgi:hypothetical protein
MNSARDADSVASRLARGAGIQQIRAVHALYRTTLRNEATDALGFVGLAGAVLMTANIDLIGIPSSQLVRHGLACLLGLIGVVCVRRYWLEWWYRQHSHLATFADSEILRTKQEHITKWRTRGNRIGASLFFGSYLIFNASHPVRAAFSVLWLVLPVVFLLLSWVMSRATLQKQLDDHGSTDPEALMSGL